MTLRFLVTAALTTATATAYAAPGVPNAMPDPAHMFAVPDVVVSEDSVDFPFIKLPRLTGDLITVYRARQPEAGFNMHPYIAHFDGRFWAMWSSNRIRDLKTGQHLRYATSQDGVTWSEADKIMEREDDPPMRYFARGFWIRNGELYSLAAYDEVVRPLFGPGLELRGYRWNKAQDTFEAPIVIADDSINNFPPKKLASGEWLMSRRSHQNQAYMAVGGVTSPSDWHIIAMPEPEDDGKLNEPFWWTLPDGTLSAAFRDGNKSRRLYRAFSHDLGRTWTAAVRTDFPDATAKFNVLRLQDGRYAMASCPNPTGVRIPICLSLSDDGIVFNRMYILRDAPTVYRYGGKEPGYAGYHYPQLLEHDDHLYIIHAENMEDIVVMRIPIATIQ